MLVRSWNLFHGNTLPPGRRSRLEQMVRLASEDRPDVLCLQEVPLWALSRLPAWSGMSVRHVVTRRALLGAWLGGAITRLNNGLFRSALAGQANAILLAPGLDAARAPDAADRRAAPGAAVLPRGAAGRARRREPARHERLRRTREVAAAEIVRAEAFVTVVAGSLPCILAGDFNLRAEHLLELAGWSARGPGIDHVLVRGLSASPLAVWPVDRRRHNGAVLSDHAPVEVTIG